MGGCVGGCAKHPSPTTIERNLRRNSSRRAGSGLVMLKKDWWSSSPEDMENNINNSHSMQRNPSIGSTSQNEETQAASNNANNSAFVNHALIRWNERRREWVGNRSQSRPQIQREPILRYTLLPSADLHHKRVKMYKGLYLVAHQAYHHCCWSTTYDDLLATNQPFPQPVPLTEMIDFLVDIWHEEGLYE